MGNMDPVQYERLMWIAQNPEPGAKPPEGLFGKTTWPQEMSAACAAALDAIDRLVEVLEQG